MRVPPAWYVSWENETRFFRQFVKAGSLCFDIGGHVGLKAGYFRDLRARLVVCVEPSPLALTALRHRFRSDTKVVIIPKAVGERVGEAVLHVADTNQTMGEAASQASTLSDTWLELAKRSQRLAVARWSREVVVPVTTLDELISEFGVPDFCKIDVEGFELSVLRGLSHRISALSFEVQPELVESICEAVARLSEIGPYVFNFSYESPLQLELAQWLPASGMQAYIRDICSRNSERHGDIYVRLVK